MAINARKLVILFEFLKVIGSAWYLVKIGLNPKPIKHAMVKRSQLLAFAINVIKQLRCHILLMHMLIVKQ